IDPAQTRVVLLPSEVTLIKANGRVPGQTGGGDVQPPSSKGVRASISRMIRSDHALQTAMSAGSKTFLPAFAFCAFIASVRSKAPQPEQSITAPSASSPELFVPR